MKGGAYREAVSSHSPGLLQPWVRAIKEINRNAVAPTGRNPFRVDKKRKFAPPGLKQPWAMGRNRFAVKERRD